MSCFLSVATADIRIGGGSSQTGVVLSGRFSRTSTTTIRAEADQVSQEGVETFEIQLSAVISVELAVPVFVEGPAMITVNDRSGEKMYHIFTYTSMTFFTCVAMWCICNYVQLYKGVVYKHNVHMQAHVFKLRINFELYIYPTLFLGLLIDIFLV